VTDEGGGEVDAAPETPPPSGPPTTYDSGPPANPYDDGGAPASDGGTDGAPSGGNDGGPVQCNTVGDCPGNNQHDTVKCTSHTCSLSCQGEFYDVNDNPTDGCERQDSPIDNHTKDKAVDLGSFPCGDGDSKQDIDGIVPTDNKVHENPNIDGFDTTVGAAPDWFKIKGTGGTFCQDDANFDFQVN